MMQARFDTCLDGLLPDGGAVLLAVSGGIDSMVMADLASKSVKGHKFGIAHCNFHLRGAESDSDEAFVREWAARKGIPYYKKDFNTDEYSSINGISIEMAARELRYWWFATICEEEGFKAVAVAHNANDNAETLFLNLLRGTGLKGICGMKDVSPLLGSSTVSLIRPLLVFSRDEIKEYALTNGLEWREDSTNANSAYKRNLIRNEVFPLFEKINPSFLETITADMSRFDQAGRITDDFVASHAPKVTRREGSGLVIDPVRLSETPNWEYLLYRLLEPYGFNESVIRDIALLIKDGSTFSGRRFLSKEYIAETSRDSITIRNLGEQGCRPFTLAAETVECLEPGEYSLDGIRFVVEQVKVGDPRQPEGVTVADLALPFTVRRWQAGDWMRPIGMKGCRKKLSDMFVDLKFSPEQKEKALVIADEGSHVLALIGYRVDESVKVEPKGPVIRIRLI